MRKIILYLFITFALSTELFSQFSGSETAGFVGELIYFDIEYSGNIETGKEYSFESDLFLSNPTVFFPLEILGRHNIAIDETIMTQYTDSTYHLTVRFVNTSDFTSYDTIFQIKGELLAGNDSMTTLFFTNVKLNDTSQENFSSVVKSTSAPGFIQYVRFARITDFYPNPIQFGETLHLDYYIDKKSVIKIWLNDLKGNGFLIGDLGIVGIGIQSFDYYIDKSMSAGMYWIVLETFTGTAYKPLIIIK